MRRPFASDHGEGLFKLQQARGQLSFAIFGDDHRRVDHRVFVDAGFAEHGEHAGIGILHIRRGVAFERQHIIPVEDVVGGAVFRQVGIFNRADTHHFRQIFQLVSRHIRVLLGHQATGALQRFVQQIRQLHGTAGAGFKRLAVFPQHHTEHMVLQRHRVRHVACFTHDGPRLHQVLVLTRVDVIEHAVGVQRFIAILRAGDIGGGVKVASILFLDDDAHRFAFLVFILIKEHHGGAFALDGQPFGFQIGDDPRQHRVVQALTHYVIAGQRHIQAIVGDLVLRHGDVDQLTPHLQEVLIAALQFNHVATCALGEGFVFVVVLFRFAIETFEVGQGHLTGVFLLLFFQIRDQHTELGAPVADVVGADHLMTQELQGTD